MRGLETMWKMFLRVVVVSLLVVCAFAMMMMVYGLIASMMNSDTVNKFDVSHLEKIDSGESILDGKTNCLGYEDSKTTSFFIGSTKFPSSRFYYSPCIEEGNVDVDILKIPAGTKLDIYKTSWSQWVYVYCIVPQGYQK